jgi:flagellar biosynthetic protein FliR
VINLTPLFRLGLLLIRPGMLFLTAPAFGSSFAPAPVKIGLTVIIAVSLAPVAAVPPVGTTIALAAVVLHEVAIGLALALAMGVLVAAAELGGQLSGFQMGLSYSAIVDPQSGVRNNLIAALYTNMTLITFFMVNGHHAFLRALRQSYAALPIGGAAVGASMPQAVVHLLGLVFTLGARIGAPVVVVLLATDLGLALVARAAPALNILAVGPSVRAMVGMLVLAIAAPTVIAVMAGATDTALALAVETARALR